ncbi:Rv1733c family protein [Streptomyces sp. SAS_260]|uniref:Rv1733c family protein n=1 Tax=Streptomyces sp. SAS_260 TaxID=3412751 RepID=UPI00403C9ED4
MASSGRGKPAKVRWWRLRPNPLRRRSYLVEAWLLIAAWTLAVVAAVGTGAWTALAVDRHVDALRAERHPVSAVLVEDAVRTVGTSDGGDSYRAVVRWTAPDGTSRTGLAHVDSRSRAGSTTHVWLDARGRLVPTPMTADQARLEGVVLAVWTAVSAGGVVLLMGRGVSGWLERRRLEQWDVEWARVGPRWGHRTG